MPEIRVATAFTSVPAGRFETDGPFSGAKFRREHLAPALKSGGNVSVFLDGVEGYGSSFLEEAFGGLVREDNYTAADLHKRLTIISQDRGWIEEIWTYIDEARPRAQHN